MAAWRTSSGGSEAITWLSNETRSGYICKEDTGPGNGEGGILALSKLGQFVADAQIGENSYGIAGEVNAPWIVGDILLFFQYDVLGRISNELPLR
jgi:hypothetical protein